MAHPGIVAMKLARSPKRRCAANVARGDRTVRAQRGSRHGFGPKHPLSSAPEGLCVDSIDDRRAASRVPSWFVLGFVYASGWVHASPEHIGQIDLAHPCFQHLEVLRVW